MLRCLGYSIDTMNGTEYDCEYPFAGFGCESCILCGGEMSPQTGKKFRGNIKKYHKAFYDKQNKIKPIELLDNFFKKDFQ